MSTGPSARRISHAYREQRFLVLLVFLLLNISVSVILEGSERQLLRATVVSVVLLAAIGCLQFKRGGVVISRTFGAVTILSGWLPIVFELPVLAFLGEGFRIVFFLLVTAALIYQVARSSDVTSGVIIGAVDGYLLLGSVGAVACAIIERASPGSFASAGAQLEQSEFLYFSFVTLATVGYGDVVPVAPVARSLVILLAVSGQIYIAVLMALLVGKYVGMKK